MQEISENAHNWYSVDLLLFKVPQRTHTKKQAMLLSEYELDVNSWRLALYF